MYSFVTSLDSKCHFAFMLLPKIIKMCEENQLLIFQRKHKMDSIDTWSYIWIIHFKSNEHKLTKTKIKIKIKTN